MSTGDDAMKPTPQILRCSARRCPGGIVLPQLTYSGLGLLIELIASQEEMPRDADGCVSPVAAIDRLLLRTGFEYANVIRELESAQILQHQGPGDTRFACSPVSMNPRVDGTDASQTERSGRLHPRVSPGRVVGPTQAELAKRLKAQCNCERKAIRHTRYGYAT